MHEIKWKTKMSDNDLICIDEPQNQFELKFLIRRKTIILKQK